jgi:hypothetical protein
MNKQVKSAIKSLVKWEIARQMGLLLNFGMPTMKEGITSVVL